mmetsp:Transcript_20906/g.65345  ORF Transcript_20906/g.65345 Transcript_20906/m.65345 type:complete len:362 (+) Transcript_20906:69-1154(+)
MDSMAYSLMLATAAAVCAAIVSTWLLCIMVPWGIFLGVLFAIMVAVPSGLFVPWYCPWQRSWSVVPTQNIFLAALLAILASTLVLGLHGLTSGPSDDFLTEQFVRTEVSIIGLSLASSLIVFLVHYCIMQEGAELRRTGRKIRRIFWKPPKAALVFCDDLAEAAPGECAICLDQLATLPSELAVAPVDPLKVLPMHGLLRLPCGHCYHGECMDRWMEREVNCPMCRKSIGSLAHCSRLCLRQGRGTATSEVGAEERRESEGAADSEAPEEFGLQLGEVLGRQHGVALEIADGGGGSTGVRSSSATSSLSTAGATCKATISSSVAPTGGGAETREGPPASAVATTPRRPSGPGMAGAVLQSI